MKRWTEEEAPPGVAELLKAHQARAEADVASTERVWRRLQSPEPNRDARWPWAVVPLMSALVLVLLLMRADGPPGVRVRAVEGPAWSGDQALEVGRSLRPPLEVRTSIDGMVELESQGEDRLRLESAGRLRGSALEQWSLLRGQVDVWAGAESSELPLEVRAEPWSLTALTSRFRVERFEDGRVRVTVVEGQVGLRGPSKTAVLRAGEVFDERAPAKALVEEPVTDALVPGSASDAPVVDEPVPPRPRRHRRVEAQEIEAPSPEPPPSPPESSAETLSRAKAASDLERALALFDRVAEAGPPLDEIAAFRAAQRLRAAGRRDEALARLRAHLTRWPSGELTELAWRDLARIHLQDGLADQAQEVLQEYVRAYPASRAQPEVSFLEGEVLRTLGEYERAAVAYEGAGRAPRFAERAGFLRGLCLARAGQEEAARRVLEAFLERHPGSSQARSARQILGEEKKSEGEEGSESFTATQKEGLK